MLDRRTRIAEFGKVAVDVVILNSLLAVVRNFVLDCEWSALAEVKLLAELFDHAVYDHEELLRVVGSS